jgi:hypothetical protein
VTGNKNIFSRLLKREAGKPKAQVGLYPQLDLFHSRIFAQPYDPVELDIVDELLLSLKEHCMQDPSDIESLQFYQQLLKRINEPDQFEAVIRFFQICYSANRLYRGKSDYQLPDNSMPSDVSEYLYKKADLGDDVDKYTPAEYFSLYDELLGVELERQAQASSAQPEPAAVPGQLGLTLSSLRTLLRIALPQPRQEAEPEGFRIIPRAQAPVAAAGPAAAVPKLPMCGAPPQAFNCEPITFSMNPWPVRTPPKAIEESAMVAAVSEISAEPKRSERKRRHPNRLTPG